MSLENSTDVRRISLKSSKLQTSSKRLIKAERRADPEGA